MTDDAVVRELAGERRIVELEHRRQRVAGVVGALWRGGSVVALCAHRCELTTLPDSIASLHSLERLDIGDNQLAALPALPAGLRELYIYDNRIERLPPLPRLTVLDANRNRLTELPPLADVAFVYAASNRLTRLPPLARVHYLNVGGNPLAGLEVVDPDLVELRVEDAGLVALPDSIGRLAGLRELSLRGNAIAVLPGSIGALAKLRVLDLRGNRLDGLPETLRPLDLYKLDLRWNPMRGRPDWLPELAARGCLVYD